MTVFSFYAGKFRGILEIHPIKSFSGEKLSWNGQKIEFSANYNFSQLIFLPKKQTECAKKINNTHILLLPPMVQRDVKPV